MRNFINVLKFSYINEVKSKSFKIITLVLILLMVISFNGKTILNFIISEGNYDIKIIDDTGIVNENFSYWVNENLGDVNFTIENKANMDILNKELEKSEIKAILVIGYDKDNINIKIFSKTKINSKYIMGIKEYVNNELQKNNIKKLNLTDKERKIIESKVKVEELQLDRNNSDAQGLGYMAIIILFITIIMYGMNVLLCVSEEKTNRIKEILLTTVNPTDLLMGKVIGIGLAGLSQLIILITSAYFCYKIFNPSSLEIGGFALSINNVEIKHIAFLIIFFILGYFLYATLFAGFGALPSKVEDMNIISLPISFMLMISFIISIILIETPNSPIMIALSIFPYSSPIVMLLRIVTVDIPLYQIFISIAILIVTILINCFIAGKIYRVGVLLYGSMPKFRDVILMIKGENK